MTKELNQTAKTIKSITPEEIKLDRQIKKVLACKPILSRILAEVVEECKGMSPEDVERCIEGEVLVDKVSVDPGLTNMEVIAGGAQEDFVPGEGLVTYDIRTTLLIPDTNGAEMEYNIKILIDVEAQKDENPGYPLPLRALFYCSRMVSSQLGTEFSNSSSDKIKYGNLKKVYSIWICTETAQKQANAIERFSINRDFLVGQYDSDDRYDLMTAIIINISKAHNTGETDNELICMLTDLLNEDMDASDKIDVLENKYHIPMTEEIKEEVDSMCSYTANVKNQAFELGMASGEAKGETKLAKLVSTLTSLGRIEDIAKAATDVEARVALYHEFKIE